jgi:hypothetical protein
LTSKKKREKFMRDLKLYLTHFQEDNLEKNPSTAIKAVFFEDLIN